VNPDPSLQIVLELEGPQAEGGHVRLHDLLEELQALKAALDSVDKQYEATKKAVLYYRVVNLTHSSPIRVTLQPVAKQRRLQKKEVDVVARHHRFFEKLQAVRDNNPPEDMEIETLDAFKRLVQKKDQAFTRATIYNGAAKVELNDEFRHNVDTLLQGDQCSYGTMTGKLQALNVHGQITFWIYPSHGPRRVYCTLPSEKRKQMLSSVDRLVRVRGRKLFRPMANFPHRIDAVDFETLEDTCESADLLNLRGTVETEEGSVEMIRKIRDEWE
jgi:hypothetical protein